MIVILMKWRNMHIPKLIEARSDNLSTSAPTPGVLGGKKFFISLFLLMSSEISSNLCKKKEWK